MAPKGRAENDMWNVPHLPIMPEQASTFAQEYDFVFWAITALTLFFTVAVMAVIGYFIAKYRQGAKADRSNPISGHNALEITWSGIPLLLALVIFAWNADLFIRMRVPPKDSMEIFVVGKQWMWHLQHPSGIRENNRLTVPVGVPVKLTMISQDVLHSFFIPQFRIKQDVIPGRYTSQWFKATKIGTYNLFCTEYCGTQHSEMGGYVRVVSQADYARWAAGGGEDKKPNRTAAQMGQELWDRFVCSNCHTDRDTEKGPSLASLLGRTRRFTDGTTAVADQAYIRESIMNPYVKIVDGYYQTMPEYRDLITEEQVIQLYEHIRTFGSSATPASTTSTPSTGR